MNYDCLIIGGGIAGLQAAIQLGRYKHRVLVIDAGGGRSAICKSYHNILGYPDGVSGQTLRDIGKKQAEDLGVHFVNGKAVSAEKTDENFIITLESGETYQSGRLLLATGVMDRIPPIPGIMPCLGVSIYVCPDCDGYEVLNKKTIVIGSGNAGANKALMIAYWSTDIILINHGEEMPDEQLQKQLLRKGIKLIEEEISEVLADDDAFQGVLLKNGERLQAEKAFLGFGGTAIHSGLAQQLGAERLENKHITVDQRTKMTTVSNVWAIGDVIAHSEQVTIAMGDGSQAAIWIHKSLMPNQI
jgi:thioredoxin reductase (NADPH)